MDASQVGGFTDYNYQSTVHRLVVEAALAVIADGEAQQFLSMGQVTFVARVGHVIVAAQPNGDKPSLHAYQQVSKERAAQRFDEVVALMNVGGL